MSLTHLLSDLTAQYEAGDVVDGLETLSGLKIALLDAPASSSLETTAVACQALELGVLLTVLDGNLDAFARNIALLKPYYDTSRASGVAPTPRKCHILGLNLMYLLVENRLSEFHSQLELLDETEARNPLISFPIELERQLMVGLYDQVLAAQVPHETFQFFVDNLLQTVRDSIADCMEVSYKEMSLESAKTMMKFSTVAELLEYIQDCREDWIVQQVANNEQRLVFQPPTQGKVSSDIPSMEWISQSLSYATEMERII
jgi:26S proteasome regulatory subunit N12